MKKTRTYATRKVTALLTVTTLTMLVEYIVHACSGLIAGNLLGESALLAISLIDPVFSLLLFLTYLISIGTAINTSYQMGRGDRTAANQLMSQGFFLMVLVSVLFSLALLLLQPFFATQFDVSPETRAYIIEYTQFLFLIPIPTMLGGLLYDLLIIEGGETVCAVVSIIQATATVGFSWLLCVFLGIRGLLLGMFVGSFLSHSILLFFFFRRPGVRLRWHFRWRSLWDVIKCSAVDSSTHLCACLMQLVLNLYTLSTFGERAVIVLNLVLSVRALLVSIFDSIGESISPVINVYRGEGNQRGIEKTMNAANRIAALEGAFVTAALLLFAEAVPRIFGVTDPALVRQTAMAIRLFALTTTAFSFVMLYTSYYLYIDRIVLSLIITGLFMFALPVGISVPLSGMAGSMGLWVGLSLSSLLTVLLGLLIVRRVRRRKTFPRLLDAEKMARELDYDVPKTRAGIGRLIDSLSEDLTARGVEGKKARRIMLMVEEAELLAIEQREEPKSIIECSVFFEDEITVILRDSGRHADPTERAEAASAEEDDLLGAPAMISRRILSHQAEKRYILTGGKNRMIFRF